MAQPELMAIGDSLFNGVRSLTINATLAQWSAPAQLAKAVGAGNFAIPDYPKNVVINFENWVSKFPNVPNILKDLNSNIDFWNTAPKSGLPQFDNLAIASTVYSDMWLNTAASAEAAIKQIHNDIDSGQATLFESLPGLFLAYNSRFVLNPTGDPAQAGLSALDIVRARKPKRLIVSIGANNGLWKMAFDAYACQGFGVENGCFGPQDLADLDEFVARLASLPPEIGHIYINALPHPSCAAVMMPPSNRDLAKKPGPGKYYKAYENRFGFTYNLLTADQVAANDAVIAAVNARVAEKAAVDPRIHIVPIDRFLIDWNWKSDAAAKTFTAKGDYVVSNLMYDPYWDETIQDWNWSGGIAGLDGMHPSFVGYNVMASTILDTIRQYEGAGAVTGALPTLQEAFAADKLLSKPPTTWHDIEGLWLAIRKANQRKAPPPLDPRAPAVESMMKAVRFKTN